MYFLCIHDSSKKILQANNLKFVTLVSANLVCILSFLATHIQWDSQAPTGWRRIDVSVLQQKIQSGDLVKKEALWYRVME